MQFILNAFEIVFPMIFLIFVLVFVHEFGHFIVAKLFNVKVEVFSIGFWKEIVQKQIGETKYCLSIIPLGGFVKLYGEDPTETVKPEDKDRAFSSKPVWQRFLVVLAGPVFNLAFAVFLYSLLQIIGEPTMTSTIGRVLPESKAWEFGLRDGDKITSINGKETKLWSDLKKIFNENLNKTIELTLTRDDNSLVIPVIPEQPQVVDLLVDKDFISSMEGISPIPQSTTIGISNPNSITFKTGLRTYDRIVKINNIETTKWYEMKKVIQDQWTKDLVIEVEREKETLTFTIKEHDKTNLATIKTELLGIYPSELIIDNVMENSPASEAQLKKGDRIVQINNKPVFSFSHFNKKIQQLGILGELQITIEREGNLANKLIIPKKSARENELGMIHSQFMIGVAFKMVETFPELMIVKEFNPVTNISNAIHRTQHWITVSLVGIARIFQKKIAASKALGGPLMIGKVAHDAFQNGIISFINVMAIISISLGLLNLFPIPVLDGGHLMFFTIEAIIRKPVSLKIREVAQHIGLTLLLLLMVFAFYNDIAKLFFNK